MGVAKLLVANLSIQSASKSFPYIAGIETLGRNSKSGFEHAGDFDELPAAECTATLAPGNHPLVAEASHCSREP